MFLDHKIVLATGNAHKATEFEALFERYIGKPIKVYTLKDIGFSGDIDENGSSFAENAMIKATAVAGEGIVAIADDSGLCCTSLGGEPGIMSARYAGTGKDEDNNKKLLERLDGADDRGASFVCAIACVFPPEANVPAFVIEGECRGEILHGTRGEGGFGYDPLFWIEEKGKTFAELSAEEKNRISHRGVAVENFVKELKKLGQL